MKITTKEKQRLKRKRLQKLRNQTYQTAMHKQNEAEMKKDPQRFAITIVTRDLKLKEREKKVLKRPSKKSEVAKK